MSNSEHQVTFMLSADHGMVVLGVSKAAWEFMASGKTHTFNLKRVGIPIDIVMFGGPTRAHIHDMMLAMAGVKPGSLAVDMTTDYAIPEDEKAVPRMRKAVRDWLFEKRDMLNVQDADIDRLLDGILRQGVGPGGG